MRLAWTQTFFLKAALTLIVLLAAFTIGVKAGEIKERFRRYGGEEGYGYRYHGKMMRGFDQTQEPVIRSETSTSTAPSGQLRCGGLVRNASACPVGYHCQSGAIPDQRGTCIKEAP